MTSSHPSSEQRPACSKCQTPMVRYNVPHTGDKEQAWRLACSCKHSAVSEVVPSNQHVSSEEQRRQAFASFLTALDAKDIPMSMAATFQAGWDACMRRQSSAHETTGAAFETDERYNVSDALVERLRDQAPNRDYFEALSDLLRLRAKHRPAVEPECQHDLLKPDTSIVVDPNDPFHASCSVCKHDFRTRAPLKSGDNS